MIKRIVFLFLLGCSAALGASAQKYLNLGFANGTGASFEIANDLALTVHDGVLTVNKADSKAAYTVADICKYEYSDVAASGIAAPQVAAPVVSVTSEGLEILFATPGHTCLVYDAAGRTVLSQQVADRLAIATGTLAAGVYIVNVDSVLTIKVSLK